MSCELRERESKRQREQQGQRETVCVRCSQEISRLSWLDRLPETESKEKDSE